MKHWRILKNVLKKTHTLGMLCNYLGFVLLDALVIWLADPAIGSYRDALWYCYAIISTVGFGDLVATTLVTRIASVLLTIYSIVLIALITGVIVNFYTEILQLSRDEELDRFLSRLENLPRLQPAELEEISARAAELRQHRLQ